MLVRERNHREISSHNIKKRQAPVFRPKYLIGLVDMIGINVYTLLSLLSHINDKSPSIDLTNMI